jgi:formamidopyrimidine-DNA glycosylase
MPELPEVNTFQRYFDQTALNQKIREVIVHDDKIIRNMSGDEFSDLLKRRTFTGSYRRGKYLFGILDNGHHVLLHFGMTGDLVYYSDQIDQPKHERFAFHFNDGFILGFDCPRKFARICYLEDLEAYLKEIKLGEDAQRITEDYFLEKIKGKKGSIKGFLLNQSILAGMGNLYADQVCYQTRVHPESVCGKIPKKKQKEIFFTMQEVLKSAIAKSIDYKSNDFDEQFSWRTDGAKAPNKRSKVSSRKIAGRTTYFAEGWQRMYC